MLPGTANKSTAVMEFAVNTGILRSGRFVNGGNGNWL